MTRGRPSVRRRGNVARTATPAASSRPGGRGEGVRVDRSRGGDASRLREWRWRGPAISDDGPVPPIGRWLWSAFRLAEVRLRIPIVLVVAAVVVGRWDVIRNYWDRLTRPMSPRAPPNCRSRATRNTSARWIPGVVSNGPGRCGVCNMALVRRKRGEAVMLPDGVVARMQLSPYRIQLAGIQTSPAGLPPAAGGSVSAIGPGGRARAGPARRSRRAAVVAGPLGRGGAGSEVVCRGPARPGPLAGRVRSLVRVVDEGREFARATIAFDAPPRSLRGGHDRGRPVPDRRGRPRALPLHAERPAAPRPGRAVADLRLPRPSRDDRAGGGTLPDRREEPDVPGARRSGAAAVVVPDASGRHRRPGRVRPASSAAGWPCAPGGLLLRRRARCWPCRSRRWSTPARGRSSSSRACPGCSTASRSSWARVAATSTRSSRARAGPAVAIAGAFLLDAETRLNPSLAAGYFGAGAARPHGDRPATAAESRRPPGRSTPALDRSLAGRRTARHRAVARREGTSAR